MYLAGSHIVLTFKERQFLGAADQNKPAAGLVDGPPYAALQAARAVCDFIQRSTQLNPSL